MVNDYRILKAFEINNKIIYFLAPDLRLGDYIDHIIIKTKDNKVGQIILNVQHIAFLKRLLDSEDSDVEFILLLQVKIFTPDLELVVIYVTVHFVGSTVILIMGTNSMFMNLDEFKDLLSKIEKELRA